MRVLNLNDNLMNLEGLEHLVSALSYCHDLQDLGISKNFIKDEGCQLICEYLSLRKCPLLKLDISDNFITELGAVTLIGMLDYSDILLRYGDMDDEEILRNTSLVELDVSLNDIKSMSKVIKKVAYNRAFKLKIIANALR